MKERPAEPERDDRKPLEREAGNDDRNPIEREAGKSVGSSSAQQAKEREAEMEESGEENAA